MPQEWIGEFSNDGINAENREAFETSMQDYATKDEAASNSIGLMMGTGVKYPEPLKTAEIRDNVFLIRQPQRHHRFSDAGTFGLGVFQCLLNSWIRNYPPVFENFTESLSFFYSHHLSI